MLPGASSIQSAVVLVPLFHRDSYKPTEALQVGGCYPCFSLLVWLSLPLDSKVEERIGFFLLSLMCLKKVLVQLLLGNNDSQLLLRFHFCVSNQSFTFVLK